ncbi:sacsin N-terminal ATP-binding-like domain-containing protein [Argonema antarcticum]|uniref:sacsin N-terminal ATP-binding-like domain-containing protein n=1 Tax=Argonema antarcticum TaxID=2942763 RepID=UPI0020117C58|nr:hypothetical protein [Argonema antarcticum]MCL1474786.1 hypothetical protein [Argonema antarcticum A004/B2]
MLSGALEQLSVNLYREKIHFALELIQNADDNEYDIGVNPSLKFILYSDKLIIQNNENGFSEKNVRAICNVNNSTKSKAEGYIGEKGIGFKSVFLVSDEPHIFSNGYHFKFKREDREDLLGFVVPYWIEELPYSIDRKQTNIVLPLRGSRSENEKLIQNINNIEASLVLFLKKLKTIEIVQDGNFVSQKITRRDEGKRTIIDHKKDSVQKTEYYFCFEENFSVQNVIEEKRQGINSSKVILAFPTKSDGSANYDTKPHTFAYLPIRQYGFKFVVQGDFILSSSREDILKDRSWNVLIRDKIAETFLKAVTEFKKDDKLKLTYYNYIPLESEINDSFFTPVVKQIHEALKQTDSVLSESGNWLKPSNLFIAGSEIRKLISNQEIKSFFSNKEYISANVKAKIEILEKCLGVHRFSLQEIFEFLQNTEWVKSKPDEWFIKLYFYLINNELWNREILLKSWKIIPLENNVLSSIFEGAIFLYLSIDKTYEFESEIRVVRKSLIIASKEIKKEEFLVNFLIRLGVVIPSPHTIIFEHIISRVNALNSEKCLINYKSFPSYIRYIKDYIESLDSIPKNLLDILAEKLWLKQHPNSNYYSRPPSLYIPKIYGNTNDLDLLFQGIETVQFVSDDYIADAEKITSPEKIIEYISKWREFFKKLGVNEGLKISEQEIEHFNTIIATKNIERITKLLLLINQQWQQVKEKLSKPLSGNIQHTKLCDKLTNSEWIPVTPNFLNKSLVKPSDAFVDKPEIRNILGNNAPYVIVDLQNQDLIKTLGINSEVTIEAVVNLGLKNLVKQDCLDKTTFVKMYTYLSQNL